MKVSISLPMDQLEFLDGLAEETDLSRSEVIQWILTAFEDDPEFTEDIFGPETEEEEPEPEEALPHEE